ncbi:hypothetical protein BDZ90DRAFT_260941 [Jaminaea rosea]|uniref:Sin3 associated polypeptide p18 n=1 Tax=Jaminaea rosea TaxID=1569628 RepID=A0A316UN11_9BASI|nr:hypothetical protein BDZ90DRAFT_260941 [Jaminaea rosea]PWN26677.1 hypothetical protein BDZ90DRAFT_260941 [Jaminaea rosea]
MSASPFILPVYVTRAATWRPLRDFESATRPLADEFHLYVWPSTTLRSLTHMLHAAAPRLTHPLNPHAFRLIFWDKRRRQYVGDEVAHDIARVSSDDVVNKLSIISRRTLGAAAEHPSSKDGLKTISDIGFQEGDFLECLIPGTTPTTVPLAPLSGPTSIRRYGREDSRAASPPPRDYYPPRPRHGRDDRRTSAHEAATRSRW